MDCIIMQIRITKAEIYFVLNPRKFSLPAVITGNAYDIFMNFWTN